MSTDTNHDLCPGQCDDDDEHQQRSEIADFFDGRSVFLTGATGFIGSVLLEQILRCCPGLERVYILLRKKKGVDSFGRKNELTRKRIFSKLAETNPEVFEKIIVVPGDLSLEKLGISPDMESEIAENVSVIFHSAADLTFNKTLSRMMQQNCLATEEVVNLARKVKNCAAFVYVSSMSSAFCRNKWEESFPQLQVSSRDMMEAARRGDEKTLSILAEKCQPPWPNTYTFSKTISEDFLRKEATDLPFAVIRPSMVLCSWKGSLPGYLPNRYAFSFVISGIARGYFHVFYADPDLPAEIISVDVVANTMLTTAWYLHDKKPKEPLVINNILCKNKITSSEGWSYVVDVAKKFPPPQLYQDPHLTFIKSYWKYLPSALVNHYLPALVMDIVRILRGRKPRLVQMYLLYDLILYYSSFMFHSKDVGKFPNDNFVMLMDSQNKKDKELFPIDVRNVNISEASKSFVTGASFYVQTRDHRTPSERIKNARRTYLINTSIKWMSIILFAILIGYFIPKKLSSML